MIAHGKLLVPLTWTADFLTYEYVVELLRTIWLLAEIAGSMCLGTSKSAR